MQFNTIISIVYSSMQKYKLPLLFFSSHSVTLIVWHWSLFSVIECKNFLFNVQTTASITKKTWLLIPDLLKKKNPPYFPHMMLWQHFPALIQSMYITTMGYVLLSEFSSWWINELCELRFRVPAIANGISMLLTFFVTL